MTITPKLLAAGIILGAVAAPTSAQPLPDPNAPTPTQVPPEPVDPTRVPTDPPPVEPTTTDVVLPAPPPTIVTTTVPPPRDVDTPEPTMFQRLGFSLSAGAGVAGFTSDSLRSTTSDGGLWDVRATLGTRQRIAIEAAYVGSAQSIDALGLDDSAVLLSNGVQGNLRLNLIANLDVQPFVFAGAAWRRYSITNTDANTSDISDEDDVLEIPVGVGIAYRYRGLVLDARGEYRPSFDEDLMQSRNTTDTQDRATMDRYGVQANIGFEF